MEIPGRSTSTACRRISRNTANCASSSTRPKAGRGNRWPTKSLHFAVQDTGIGIPPESLERIRKGQSIHPEHTYRSPGKVKLRRRV